MLKQDILRIFYSKKNDSIQYSVSNNAQKYKSKEAIVYTYTVV